MQNYPAGRVQTVFISTEDPRKKILWAAENNMMETVKELLDIQPDLIHSQDGDGYTPLHRACYNGHIHMVKVRVVCNGILEK